MKKLVLTAVAAVTLSGANAFAADLMAKKAAPPPPPPSPWDVAFGGALMTDYLFRGITQSNHRASVAAYTELRYNMSPSVQLYGGISGESIDFPNHAAAEIDLYGGIRPTFGPLALDFGFWYYYYSSGNCFAFAPTPAGCFVTPGNFVAKEVMSFWEVYAKATWTVNDQWAVGGNLYYSPNIMNTGADGTYLSGTLKYTAPASAAIWNGQVGWYVSGEIGEQFLGTSDAFYGTGIPGNPFQFGTPYVDYVTWNIGLGLTYKVFTLDLRYSDTDLSQGDCAVYTSDHTATINPALVGSTYNPIGASSKWCGSVFLAKFSFDATLGALK